MASAIPGCVTPLSRSNTIWMRWRCAAGILHRSAVFNCRTWRLLHLTIGSPESDGHRESHHVPQRVAPGYRKLVDSICYGVGIRMVIENVSIENAFILLIVKVAAVKIIK